MSQAIEFPNSFTYFVSRVPSGEALRVSIIRRPRFNRSVSGGVKRHKDPITAAASSRTDSEPTAPTFGRGSDKVLIGSLAARGALFGWNLPMSDGVVVKPIFRTGVAVRPEHDQSGGVWLRQHASEVCSGTHIDLCGAATAGECATTYFTTVFRQPSNPIC